MPFGWKLSKGQNFMPSPSRESVFERMKNKNRRPNTQLKPFSTHGKTLLNL